MPMEYFCCYHSYLKKIEKLSDNEVGRLFRSLLEFSATAERPELNGREAIAFDFMADDIDRTKANYEEKCRKNRANGARGGERTPPNATERPQSVANAPQNKNENKNENKGLKDLSPKILGEEFETIWSSYPRKEGRKDAYRHYCAARKRGVDYETVKAGVVAYAAHVKAAETETQFIKTGSTWFCGEHWGDELSPILPPRARGNGYNAQPLGGESEFFEAAVATINGGQ